MTGGGWLCVFLAVTLPVAAQERIAECKEHAFTELPPGAGPSATERAALRDCDSEALYYGIGRDADPVAARHCAALEMEAGNADEFHGAGILMMIYGNGLGVARDLDLAQRLACELGGADAEVESRLDHLQHLGSEAAVPFDVCDDRLFRYMIVQCAEHEERVRAGRRDPLKRAAAARMPASARDLLARAEAAARTFIEASTIGEVNHDGSITAGADVRHQGDLDEEWAVHLDWLSARRLPHVVGSEPFQSADAALNAAYRRVMHADVDALGTVTKDGVRSAQRAWLRYRDAWDELVAAVDPDRRVAWETALTQSRTEALRVLVEGDDP